MKNDKKMAVVSCIASAKSNFPLLHNNLIYQINNLNTFKNEETFIFFRNA